MPTRSGLAMLAFLFYRSNQAHDAIASGQGTVQHKLEVRGVAQIEALLEVVVQKPGGALQMRLGILDDFFIAEDAEVDLRRMQVRRGLHIDDRDQRLGEGSVFD